MILVNEVTLAGKQLPAGVTVFFICSEFKLLTVSKSAFRHKNYALQKNALYYSVFKERAKAIEKAP